LKGFRIHDTITVFTALHNSKHVFGVLLVGDEDSDGTIESVIIYINPEQATALLNFLKEELEIISKTAPKQTT
jgi:hypothetical protein